MNRIVQVINAMISNVDKIDNVSKSGYERYYFLYNNKHKWAISYDENNDDYFLTLYPVKDLTISQIIDFEDSQCINEPLDSVIYKSSDQKSREATESYAELYNIVKSKVFGVDDIFNDILK
jgi:hypothetical protein